MNIKFISSAFLLLLLLSGTASFAQKLILFEKPEGFGYKDTRGRVIIPPRFSLAEEFSKEGIAAVVDDKGWAIIDRSGRVLIRTPFIFDNGPDYFAESLARFTDERGKFGFYDKRGRIIIAPQFDFALPFREGAAAVCMECRKTEADINGHYGIGGGRWGFIDRRGAVIIPLRFEDAENFENGRALVKFDDKQIRIDKRGRIFKR